MGAGDEEDDHRREYYFVLIVQFIKSINPFLYNCVTTFEI